MMKMKRASLLLLIAAVFAPCGLPLRADTVVEEIVAHINSAIVTLSEFQRSREQLKTELKEKYPQEADRQFAERDKDVLRDLIDQDLLVQKGKDLGISGDSEVIKRLDEMRKQMNLNSMEELEKAAQDQGVNFDDFKQNMRNQIITQMVIGREVGSKLSSQITHDDVVKFYEAHQKEMEHPESVQLAEILIAIKAAEADKPTPEEIAAAQARANELLEALKKGANFEETAKKSSEGPSAAQGGDLGTFNRGMLAKELEAKVFALPPGGTTDVIRTRQGFIILKIIQHTPAGVPTVKEVEPQIQEAIYVERLQPALRAYLTRLREEAFIEIVQGYVDTGASPNQTKLTYTTTAEEEKKKKKKKKHFLLF